MGLAFEWTFRAGDVLTLIGAMVVAAAFLYNRGGQETGVQITLDALTKQLTEMKIEFKAFSETLTKVATQEVKINLLMKWYDELRRGDGFVRGPGGIDREYP